MKKSATPAAPGTEAGPSRTRGRPKDPDRLRRILETAGQHFFESGFERASLDAMARDAGVSKMTIYSHFASKEALFEAVIGARTERVVAHAPDTPAPDPHHPAAALHAIGEQFLVLMRDENVLGQFRALYAAAGTQAEACDAFYRQGAHRLVEDLAAYLSCADGAGTLRVPLPGLAADLYLGMFLGTGHIRGMLKLGAPTPEQDQALLQEAVRVFMAAYAPAPAATGR